MVRSLGALMIVLLTAGAASAQDPEAKRPSLLVPLYASQIALQGLDVHSTVTALRAGNVEGNPMLRNMTPTQMLATKVVASSATILVTEKLWKRHRIAAVGLMLASNATLAFVAARNYDIARR